MSQTFTSCFFCLIILFVIYFFFFFFFNDTATTEIYTLSLHDALPISLRRLGASLRAYYRVAVEPYLPAMRDRKSTRLNSSHLVISYAVFCLKKKKRSAFIPHRQDEKRPGVRL